MKRYAQPLILLLLVVGLSACSPTAASSNSDLTAVTIVPTVGLAEITATTPGEPAIPTSTSTTPPTVTVEPSSTPGEKPTTIATMTVMTTTVPLPVPDDPTAVPDDLLITFMQTGGFAGVEIELVIERSGRVRVNGDEGQPLSEEEITILYQTLMSNQFFTLGPTYKTIELCCDFFTYTLAVRANGQTTTVTTVGGPPDTPDWLWNSLQPFIGLTDNLPLQ
ncbi:MAG: hypothetical protein KA314_24345 [Chloroflexi bacterium]|nr:hypothetical protein [Chloroflexota bacterium]MBP8058976.1 hypothetical protein [Chloroflexota bacterium]